MNTTVIVVACFFVVVGIALIALSIVLGGRTKTEDAPVVTEVPNEERPAVPATAFIDEPLKTDLSAELGTPSPLVAADPDAEAEAAQAIAAPAAAESATPVPAVTAVAGTAERPTPRQVSYDFRVQLAYKYLKNDLPDEAVAEFRKALDLTDDAESKAELNVEIGNVLRSQGMYEAARVAYGRAAEYADSGPLSAHLEHMVADMVAMQSGAPPADTAGESPAVGATVLAEGASASDGAQPAEDGSGDPDPDKKE